MADGWILKVNVQDAPRLSVGRCGSHAGTLALAARTGDCRAWYRIALSTRPVWPRAALPIGPRLPTAAWPGAGGAGAGINDVNQ